MLLFSRDDHGDFIAARGYRGRGSLAHQLVTARGPPAVTPAGDGEKPSTPVVHETALNKSLPKALNLQCVLLPKGTWQAA